MIASHHEILVGDCRATLRTLPEASVHCCVTSPPYWGLRDYQTGSPDEIGSEPTLDDHLRNIVDVGREVWRVLRDDGTFWVNYEDAFCGGGGFSPGAPSSSVSKSGKYGSTGALVTGGIKPFATVKPKDLLCLPHRVAMALQSDGWYLRQCIIWCKSSPMPESVRGSRWERCRMKVAGTGWDGHEHPSKRGGSDKTRSRAYGTHGGKNPPETLAQWTDCPGCPKCRDNPAECVQCKGTGRATIDGEDAGDCIVCDGKGTFGGYVYCQSAGRPTTAHEFVFLLAKSPSYYYAMDENRAGLAAPINAPQNSRWRGDSHRTNSSKASSKTELMRSNPAGRNLWSYWDDISPSAFKDSHFATMPLDLARRCIKLGTSSVGVCSKCGAPWAPVVERAVPIDPGRSDDAKYTQMGQQYARRLGQAYQNQLNENPPNILDHRPTCRCNAEKAPAVVLDPFGGAGTTAIAARELGHSSIICELNSTYAGMARKRMRAHFTKASDVRPVKPMPSQRDLF